MAELTNSPIKDSNVDDNLPKSFTQNDVQATSTPLAATNPHSQNNNNESTKAVASNLVNEFKVDNSSDDSSEESRLNPECSRTESVNGPLFTASLSSTCSSYKDAHDASPKRQTAGRTDSERTSTSYYSDAVTSLASDSVATTVTSLASVRPETSSDSRTPKPEKINVPIMGYEIMEQRARFTVFKLHVKRGKFDDWFIFRRYTDFHRLNEQLRPLFPHFRLSLPPKKWFGDNFDYDFLEDRQLGLQAFIDNVIGHPDVSKSKPVREFFCLNEPPGPHESLEESRALCQSLEEELYCMKKELQDRDTEISLLRDEMSIHKAEVDSLRRALRLERALTGPNGDQDSPSQSETSLPETDQALKLVIEAQASAAIGKLKEANIPLEKLVLDRVKQELTPEGPKVMSPAEGSKVS